LKEEIEMRANTRGLVFLISLFCFLGLGAPPVQAQMVPKDSPPAETAMAGSADADSARSEMDNGKLKILFVRPWSYIPTGEVEADQEVFLLSYQVGEGFKLEENQSVVLLGSSDDEIDGSELKIADVISKDSPRDVESGTYSLMVLANKLSLLQGLGRGNLVLALVVVDDKGNLVIVEDTAKPVGDMSSICTGYDKNPEDLRIIDPDHPERGGLEEVDDADLDVTYLVDADKTFERDPAEIEYPPETEVPALTWQANDQCQGEMADLKDAWINEVRLQENDEGRGPTTDLRCSVTRVAFDIWYVEDSTLDDAGQLAGAIDTAKLENGMVDFTEQEGTRFFRLYTSPLTAANDDPLSSLKPETNYPNEVGELGDPVYGVWGYWGNGPLSKNNLYNMVARIEREGRIRLEKRYADEAIPAGGGHLFLYVYDPSWYGLRWVTDGTEWKGHWVPVHDFVPRVKDGHIAYDTNLGNNVLLLDGSPGIPGYGLAVMGPDSTPWYDPSEGGSAPASHPAPAPVTAGAPITIEVDATQLGNCPDDIAAVVTYADPKHDVDVSGELAGKDPHTSNEARLEILDSRQDQSDPKYRGVRKLTVDELGSDVSLQVMLPSSVKGEGTIKVLLVPWQQVEDGKLVAGGTDLYETTPQIRSGLRIFSERNRELDVAGVADVGFNYTKESFPWPDPFFQKNNKEYVHKGVQLFNAGTTEATLTLQVLLVKDSSTADVCTSEVSPDSDWGRLLLEKDETISPDGGAAVTEDIEYKLKDLHPEETLVVIRILNTGNGGNMTLHCVEKKLVQPLSRHDLEEAYTVFGAADDTFKLTLKTSQGGPGFTASVELTNEESGQPDEDVTSGQEEVTVPNTTSSTETKTADLNFSIGKDIDPLASHRYKLVVTSTDLFADPYTVEAPISVNIVKAAPDLAGSAEMTVLPVAAALPGVGNPWRTAAWFFNQEAEARTYEVGYVLSRDVSTNNGGGNLYAGKAKARAMTVSRQLTLGAKGRPDSLKQYGDALDELFGIVTKTKGWIYVKPVQLGGEMAQDPWPSKFPMVAEEVYSVGDQVIDPDTGETSVPVRGQFVVAQPLSWLATTPAAVHAPLVIPPPAGGEPISTRVNLHVTVFGDQAVHFKIVAIDSAGGEDVVAGDLEVKANAVVNVSLKRDLRPAWLQIQPLDTEDVPYAVVVSQVDNGSDDPISFPGQSGGVLASGGDRVVVPVIARTSGQHGSQWFTDLTLANTGEQDATYSFRFFPDDGAPELPETPMEPEILVAHNSVSIHDVVQNLGSAGGNTKGLLLVDLQGGGKDDVLVASRTYTVTTCDKDGEQVQCTYGQRVPGYAATPQILQAGQDAGVLFALDLGVDTMRENLGLVNVGDEPATAVLRLMDHNGEPLKLKGTDGKWMDSLAVTANLEPHELHHQTFDATSCSEEHAPCIASFFAGKLAAKSRQVDDNGNSLLQGCVLEVGASSGEITAYLTKVDNTSNDALFIPVVQPQGYGTSLPDSGRSELHIATGSSTVGRWEKVDLVLRDSNGRPLPGYGVTVASSRPYYLRFKGADDGEEYPRWKITDSNGKASFELTSHAPGVSEYHLQWANRETINIGNGSGLDPVDLTTKDSCEWEVEDIESQVAEESVVGRPETMTVTMKEADGSPVWPGLTVELASDRPEDTPSGEDHLEVTTDENGVATFTVGSATIGLTKWHAMLHDQEDKDTVGGESGTTTDDQTLWSLDEEASSVVVGDPTPAAGPTDGSDCNGDGKVDAGDTLTVTTTLMGENGQPVINAKAVLNTSYGKDTILTTMPVITDDKGVAVFQVEVPPVNGDVPISASYTATASPNSGTSTDPVQTVGKDPDNTTEWQDESPAFVKDFDWTLTNGFLTETNHGLDFDAHECIGHVDAFDLTIQRQDDNRYWDPTSKTWIAGETWFPATVQPKLNEDKAANTWDGSNSWDDLPQDMVTRANSEGFEVEWKVRATDGGANEAIYSGGVQPVDYLVPEIVGGFVSRRGTGSDGDLPLAGEGFDIWSTASEYNPASGESWYRLVGGDASGLAKAAPAAAISGSPNVTLEPVTLDVPVLGGDQKFGALGGRLVDQAGHDSGPVLDEAWAVFVKPLPAGGFFQDGAENPDADRVGCGATGLATLLQRNPADPAVARNDLQYAFLLDADSSGDISPGDYWLSIDGNGSRRWSSMTNGPTYLNAVGWGIGSGSWSDPLILPVADDSHTPQRVMEVTQDHQILVYVHNPMEGADPVPGDDPNTVSESTAVVTEGLPTIETFILGNDDASLHECEPGGIHGTFSDDDGKVAEIQILISGNNGQFFDGASNQWVGGETWFTVTHDDDAHTWSWEIPHELIAGHQGESVEISVRALDDDEGSCTACQGDLFSCNTPRGQVTLENDPPIATFAASAYPALDDGDAVGGTISDTEFDWCADDSGYTVELQLQAADTGEYWNGSSWQASEVWFSQGLAVDWSAGTWSYTLPAGFHDTLGGSDLSLHIRATDDFDEVGPVEDATGDVLNENPTINITSSLTDLTDGGAISGTLSDDSQDGGSTAVDLKIQAADTGEYWNGASWQAAEVWFPATVFDWSGGTWSYTLPAGFHDTVGGSSLTMTARATDRHGLEGTDDGTGNVKNNDPVIDITSNLTDLDDNGAISGTLSDDSQDGGSTAVDLKIQAADTGEYWNGASWQAAEVWFPATVFDWSGGTWSYAIPASGFHDTLGGSSLTVTARATDRHGLHGSDSGTGNVKNNHPVIDITSNLIDLDDNGAISGTLSDDSQDGGSTAVDLKIQAADTGQYWNGVSWQATEVWFPATVFDWSGGTWSYAIPASGFHDTLGGSSLTVMARATDQHGAQGSDSGNGNVKNNDPVISITSNLIDLTGGGAISGTLSDDSQDGGSTAVDLKIQAADTGQYWNGVSWQAAEVWFPATAFNWSGGTWSYTLPAGFGDTVGGSNLTITARATDYHGLQGSDTGTGSAANANPTIAITSNLVDLEDGSTISGTLNDDSEDGGSTAVDLKIQAADTGEYWNGTSWQGTEVWFPATFDWSGGTWSYAIPASGFHDTLGGSSLTVTARATDRYGLQGSDTGTGNVKNNDPVIDITSNLADLDDGSTISGTLSDDNEDGGSAAVDLKIQAADTGEYWNGTSWQGTEVWFLAAFDWSGGTWSYAIPASGFHDTLGGSSLTVTARATDRHGLQGTNTGTGNVSNGNPTIAITSSLTDLGDGSTISGTLSDDSQDGGSTAVDLKIQAADTGEYWNGTSWQGAEVWFAATVFDWNGGTWSYAIPASGFHDTLGGSSLTVTARATDRHGLQGTDTGTGNVGNNAPAAADDTSGTDEDTATGNLWSSVLSNDSDDSQPPLSISSVDTTGTQGLVTLNSISGTLVYDPNGQFESLGAGDTATDTFTYTVVDIHGASDTATVTVTITGVNDAPETTGISDQTNDDNDSVNLNVSGSFSDVEGDTLTYSMIGQPSGLTINATTGVISGTIASSASTGSPYTVTVTANDGQGGTVNAPFTWTVNNPAPTTTGIPDQTNHDNDTVSLDVSGYFSDPDGDTLSYTMAGQPSGLTINATTGVISGTIASSASTMSPYGVGVIADDSQGGAVSATFMWTIQP